MNLMRVGRGKMSCLIISALQTNETLNVRYVTVSQPFAALLCVCGRFFDIVKLPAIGRRLIQTTFAVLLVRHLHSLRLVTSQFDRATNLGRNLGSIATFAQQ